MKLVVPTDFDILAAMSDGRRQTATNIAAIIDRDSRYMNNRLAELAGHGLVEKVGPADQSGMYVITDRGLAALELKDEYDHDLAPEYDAMIDEKLADDS